MTGPLPLVIVGTGLAGYTLAREWRRLDRERPLVMITADDGSFYSKPMLSNGLAQNKAPADLAIKPAADMARELGARIHTKVTVDAIVPGEHRLIADGAPVEFDSLCLAVGARPIRIPLAGTGAAGVMSVNNLGDYRHFRERLASASSVAIMGPGLIGCEFANDLAARGFGVDCFGPDPWPLSTLLPEAAGRALEDALTETGVRFHLGTTAARIDAVAKGVSLTLDTGGRIDADMVLSAVGLRPDTRLAADSGLTVNRGIVTDRYLRTSAPDIYALGDCSETDGLNMPYVMPIMHGARALARTLTGAPTAVTYPPMPVVIKTPALAVVVCPPPLGATGHWRTSGDERNVRAIFQADDDSALGFALTGEATAEKQALTKMMSASR